MNRVLLKLVTLAALCLAGLSSQAGAGIIVIESISDQRWGLYAINGQLELYDVLQEIYAVSPVDGTFVDINKSIERPIAGASAGVQAKGSAMGMDPDDEEYPPNPTPTTELGFETATTAHATRGVVEGTYAGTLYETRTTSLFYVTKTQEYDLFGEVAAATSFLGDLASDRGASSVVELRIAGLSMVKRSDNGSPLAWDSIRSRVTLMAGVTYDLDFKITTEILVGSGRTGAASGPESATAAASARLHLAMVPEPASLTILATGGLSLLGFSRRRKSRNTG